jgi:alkanesulfonate monooxygenase SsuD/methylene tetrahydromethanopterin reductase-like flavin-dependent oxidoreductase (luciferase family)
VTGGTIVGVTQVPKLAVFVTPTADPPGRSVEVAVAAERAGFDYVTVQDHPYQARFDDTWTLLSWMAARTERVALLPNVANLALRPPAVLAKAAATLDRLSGGRFALGLGAGGFPDAIAAMGGPRRRPADSLGALREAIAVIRAMWSTERAVRIPGAYYQLAGVHPGPPPTHPIGIWLGVYGPRALTLLGEVADGWSVSVGRVPEDELARMHARIDAAAVDAGRDPEQITRMANLGAELDEPDLGPRLVDYAREHRFDVLDLPVPPDPDYVLDHGSRLVEAVRLARQTG